YNWHVIPNIDGHNPDAILQAIKEAKAVTDKPSLLCCKTIIGYGAPNLAGTEKTHGAPLGEDEVAGARKKLGWNYPAFVIPNDVYAAWDAREKGTAAEASWQDKFNAYQQKYPELAAELLRRINQKLPAHWQEKSKSFIQTANREGESIATRKASQKALNQYGALLPELVGGSADLSESNCTHYSLSKDINREQPGGNYIYYGVREFGMSAIMNGIALHGGFIPFGGTFLVFCDYARNAVRLSALMKQRVIYVYSHDSIGLGEDGPTHQPIEHASMLRLTPNMSVWRPCDVVETAVAWKKAIEHVNGPTALLLTRQTTPHETRDENTLNQIERGGYILKDCGGTPDIILIATGSEVSLAVQAFEQLTAQGKKIRVVSMPSTDVFDAQDAAYRESVLPAAIRKRIAIEAGATGYWYKYVGLDGTVIGIDRYGESAPAKAVYQALNITTEHIIQTCGDYL
ncbi:MAG: transketolase, partial [Proteobacteria bacterium]|nr:transketolase [Pseudomonadota bacterium]